MNKKHEEREHSPVGASGAHRWMNCPGSVFLNELFPDETSEWAEEGTRAHEMAEAVLRDEIIVLANDEDQEMFNYVSVYTDYVTSMYNKCKSKSNLFVEQEVHIPIHEDLWGTVDAAFIDYDTDTLHIADLKYGLGIGVEVVDNPQMLYYALGAYYRAFGVRNITMHIVQPRFDRKDLARSWTVSVEEIIHFQDKLLSALIDVERANDHLGTGKLEDRLKDYANTTFCPSEKTCQWCKGMSICPAMQEKFTKDTGIVPTEHNPGLPEINNMTPTEIGHVVRNLPLLKKFLESIKKRAFTLVSNGTPVPHVKIVEQIKHRVIKDPKEAKKTLQKKGFKVKDIMETKMKSPSKLEALGVPKNIMDEIVYKPKGDLILVTDEDKREPATGIKMDPIKPKEITCPKEQIHQ